MPLSRFKPSRISGCGACLSPALFFRIVNIPHVSHLRDGSCRIYCPAALSLLLFPAMFTKRCSMRPDSVLKTRVSYAALLFMARPLFCRACAPDARRQSSRATVRRMQRRLSLSNLFLAAHGHSFYFPDLEILAKISAPLLAIHHIITVS